jgi:glycosyltransferase involved in cell wall biosynthesis
MMRLAFVSVSDQLGGSEVVLLNLLEQLTLRRPDWALHVISPGPGPLAERARATGASVHIVPMPDAVARVGESAARGHAVGLAGKLAAAAAALPGYEERFGAELDAARPDVIHSNGLKAHVLAARASSRARRLWHLHEYIEPRPLSRRLLRWYAPRCDGWVANSASVSSDVSRATASRLRTPARVIPNGVNLQRFTPDGPRLDLDALCGLPSCAPGVIKVGLVATFSRWKGHDVFLRAVAQIPRDSPIRAYVIGAPVYDTTGSQYSLEEMKALAQSLGCADRVGFTGFQPDAPAVMRALDVVVHASTAPEPFGLVLIEAMASGRALISSGAGGSAEIVRPGVNALVHTPGDVRSLADAILRLANDASLRERLGTQGRAHAAAHYDVATFGERFVSAYEELAADPR